MSQAMDMEASARAAGAAGRSWGDWCCDDAVQAYVDEHGADADAWGAAYEVGALERRRTVEGWVERWTTAPKDYDTFGTATLAEEGDWRGRPLRRVLMCPTHEHYQRDRYGSGLHASWEVDPRVEERELAERSAREQAERDARAALRSSGLGWLRDASDAELDAADESDDLERRGLGYSDLRAECARRTTERADAGRRATWERCRSEVSDGVILVDDGEPSQQGRWGRTPGRAAHVYYGCTVANDWRQDADEAVVRDDVGDQVGSLSTVVDWLASGRLRVVAADQAPPAKVTRRIGHERYRDILRVDVGDLSVWVGHAMFHSEPWVLDERGRVVRARHVRDAALAALAAR